MICAWQQGGEHHLKLRRGVDLLKGNDNIYDVQISVVDDREGIETELTSLRSVP